MFWCLHFVVRVLGLLETFAFTIVYIELQQDIQSAVMRGARLDMGYAPEQICYLLVQQTSDSQDR